MKADSYATSLLENVYLYTYFVVLVYLYRAPRIVPYITLTLHKATTSSTTTTISITRIVLLALEDTFSICA